MGASTSVTLRPFISSQHTRARCRWASRLFMSLASASQCGWHESLEAWHHGSYFVPALWAGLAAPTGLYSSTPQYPYYVGTYSVPQSFGQVGSYLSYALKRCGKQSAPSAQG
jgi:hypothetical protein